jgi:hypothetical protein
MNIFLNSVKQIVKTLLFVPKQAKFVASKAPIFVPKTVFTTSIQSFGLRTLGWLWFGEILFNMVVGTFSLTLFIILISFITGDYSKCWLLLGTFNLPDHIPTGGEIITALDSFRIEVDNYFSGHTLWTNWIPWIKGYAILLTLSILNAFGSLKDLFYSMDTSYMVTTIGSLIGFGFALIVLPTIKFVLLPFALVPYCSAWILDSPIVLFITELWGLKGTIFVYLSSIPDLLLIIKSSSFGKVICWWSYIFYLKVEYFVIDVYRLIRGLPFYSMDEYVTFVYQDLPSEAWMITDDGEIYGPAEGKEKYPEGSTPEEIEHYFADQDHKHGTDIASKLYFTVGEPFVDIHTIPVADDIIPFIEIPENAPAVPQTFFQRSVQLLIQHRTLISIGTTVVAYAVTGRSIQSLLGHAIVSIFS